MDKSDSISAMEAFEFADRKTGEFYESQKRLATEHAVFEDTGKGEAVRATSKTEGSLLSSLIVLRIGPAKKLQMIQPGMRCLQGKKTWSRRSMH
jgi:hypothetical protein